MEENKITRLTVGKKNRKKVNVYLDGIFSFSIYRETAAWLEVGQILSDEKIRELLAADLINDIWVKATEFISFKPRTVQETRRKLQSEGYDSKLIDEAIERLLDSGLLDDKRFAEQWVEERSLLKPRSKRALEFELRKRGIPDNLIQSVIEETDEFKAAYETARKRIYRYDGLTKLEFRAKLGNYLAGKGFSYDVISDVIKELWEELHSSNTDNI